MFDLSGKVCLVTGSAGGIGLEIVKICLQKGAKCLMVDINYRVSLKSCLHYKEKCSLFFVGEKTRQIFNTVGS